MEKFNNNTRHHLYFRLLVFTESHCTTLSFPVLFAALYKRKCKTLMSKLVLGINAVMHYR